MDWSPWKSLRSDGTIPEDLLPCEMFELKWLVEWLLNAPENSFTENLTGRWRWEITQSSGLVFDSEVKVKGTAVWLDNLLITWWVDGQNTEIRTRTPEKPPILGADPDAWTQRSDGTWENPAEVGFVDGWSDSGGMADDIPVYVDYNTCAYLIPLGDGAKVAVPFHNVGAFWTVKLANIQIRTAGAGGFGTYTDEVGIHRIADPSLSRLEQRFSRDGGRNYEPRKVPFLLRAPSVSKEPTNALLIAGKLAETGWVVAKSLDDGLTWSEELEPVWDTTYSDCKVICARDGARVTIARKANVLWSATSRDGYASIARVGEAQKAFELAEHRSSGRLTATDGQGTTYQSLDGGRSWQTVVQVT